MFKSHFLTSVSLLVILLALSSCLVIGEKTSSIIGMAVLTGLHNNSAKVELDSILKDKIYDVLYDFGTFRIIVIDGDPNVSIDKNGHAIGYVDPIYLQQSKQLKQVNPSLWESSQHIPRVNDIYESIVQLTPDSPEVDTLTAIKEAGEMLHGMLRGQEQSNALELVIFDTGLCTAGPLSFLQMNMLDLLFTEEKLSIDEIQPLIQSLNDHADLPDLTGIRVIWYGLGKVAGDQKLSNLNIENLRTIWTAILQSANAIPYDPNSDSTSNYFSFVPTYSEANYAQPVTKVINWNKGEKILEESLGGFEENSSRFLDKQAAIIALTPIANNLKNYSSMEIMLVGTTSDPERHGGDVQLSKERADAVKELLINLGVSDSQITTYGWGANEPFYDEREWEGNHYIQAIAASNRSVIVISKNNDLASRVLQGPKPGKH